MLSLVRRGVATPLYSLVCETPSAENPRMGSFLTEGWRVMPPAEYAGPFLGMPAQVLDWLKVQRENPVYCDARYAAGTATVTNYDGDAMAAELHS